MDTLTSARPDSAGINSEASVSRLKGTDRPILHQADRVTMLEALECVDRVEVFDEDTPCELIRRLRPDVVVKGDDYSRETMPEAEIVEGYGGRVVIVPMLEGYSTTGIVGRISPNPEVAHVQEEATVPA
jgi:rfaE bifunctional protein nucleotidyltransferase chain/domain